MLLEANGGYDDGYVSVRSFWGTKPGSLVAELLQTQKVAGLKVLDVGAGEGKNAAALSRAGACVDAIECSPHAIRNGQELFASASINWIEADAADWLYPVEHYDVVVCYGLIHCLASELAADRLIGSLQRSLKADGIFILVSFNDGSHDLSGHPGFAPLFLPHAWFLRHFQRWTIQSVSDSILFETHPHNNIPHHHSLTRLSAVKS